MLYEEQPPGFQTAMDVVSCGIYSKDQFLFLQRSENVQESGLWGFPTGKVDPGETTEKAMIREIEEETGYKPTGPGPMYYKTWYVSWKRMDFIYHLYLLPLIDRFTVTLATREHQDYKWCDLESARKLELVPDMESILAFLQKHPTF